MPPLPVTAAQALLTNLGNEAKALIQRDNSPLFDPGGFLADPDAPPLSQQPAKALGRAICRAWSRRPGDSNNPAADRLYGGACNEYLDSIGELPQPGSIGRPFEGGQCPGVAYDITWEQRQQTGPGAYAWVARSRIAPGLIGPVSVTSDNLGTTCGDGLYESRESIRGFNGGGATLLGTGGCSDTLPGYRNLVLTPRGGASECGGDPPPEYQPPYRGPGLPPITPIFIDLPDIGEVNVEVSILPDATINLCSEDLDTCVTIAPPGGGDDGSGGVGPDDLVPDGGLAGSPADTGNGGVASGEAPPGNELVGVRVEVLEAPIGFNQYANNAAVVYRGIGYVRMGYTGRLALDVGASAVISPQFFLAPVRGLTAWEHRANTGFINRVTPFYRELPS